jgi:hypothetical protein
MAITKDRQESIEKLDDLKSLLAAGAGPCLSVYMSLSNASTAGRNPNAKENELRWRECLQTAESQASQFGEAGKRLIDSVQNFESVFPDNNGEQPRLHGGKSIALFRSAEVSQIVELDGEVTERAVLGRTFYIRPLVKELVRTRNFYLLALSQKNTRLLHCTTHTSEELAFPEGFATDFEQWMNQAKPDHTAVNNAMAVGAQGSVRPDALAPKGSDAEDRDEYLSHFAKHIAGGVGQVLKGRSEPLVLCAVEYEVPIYREVNMYPHLASEAVHGAPNGLKSGEMHARALDALSRCYDKKVEEALGEWNHRVGGGASSRLEEVVTAAHDGRVLTLLASDSQDALGSFDDASHTVRTKGQGSKEDLVNDAIVQTIRHAGKVLVVEASKMPENAAVAATFRF